MADEKEVPSESAMVATELALKAFSNSEVHSNDSCSKSCKALKEYEKLKEQYDEQRLELNQTSYKPDIMFNVCLGAPFQEDPKIIHLEAVKRIFRYIKGTTHLGLWYPKGTGVDTIVHAYLDYVDDYVDRKSTSGICTFIGHCLTSWFSKKQTALAISTTEAEYVSAGKACQ